MFFVCHVRCINPVRVHPEKISRRDKELAKNLDYDDFQVKEKDFEKIEIKNKISVNAFGYEICF